MKNKKNASHSALTISKCLNKKFNLTVTDIDSNTRYGDDQVLYTHRQEETLVGKFAKLKYGNDLELIFNIDCQVLVQE